MRLRGEIKLQNGTFIIVGSIHPNARAVNLFAPNDEAGQVPQQLDFHLAADDMHRKSGSVNSAFICGLNSGGVDGNHGHL